MVQFCGDDPATLIAAARMVEGKCDAIELNCGCPQVKTGLPLLVGPTAHVGTRACPCRVPVRAPSTLPPTGLATRPLPDLSVRISPGRLSPHPPPLPAAPARLSQAIARRGHYGAFLLDEPDLIVSIVEQLTGSVSTPVMVKMRVVKPRAEGQAGAGLPGSGGDSGADECAGEGDGRGLAATDSTVTAAAGTAADGEALDAPAARQSEGGGTSFETLDAATADAADAEAALAADEEARFYQSTMRLALRLQAAGAAVLTLHGRTKEQKTKVECDWKAIATLKRVRARRVSTSAACTGVHRHGSVSARREIGARPLSTARRALTTAARGTTQVLSIPVVANGGVENFEDLSRCLATTGADGVMSSEAALENPAVK